MAGRVACFILFVSVFACVDLRPASASGPKPFGIARFSLQTTAPTGEQETPAGSSMFDFTNPPSHFTQAGGHPWGITATGEVTNEEMLNANGETTVTPTQDPKDIVNSLPLGLVGDPMAVPRCALARLGSSLPCPADTQIGVAVLKWFGGKEVLGPIENMTPETGQSAEFGIDAGTSFNPLLTAHLVRTEGGYGFAVSSNGIASLAGVVRFELTFWGVPGDQSHDVMRGRRCASAIVGEHMVCHGGGEHFGFSPIVPFVTMPTNCGAGPETTTLRADSWQEPGEVGVNGQYNSQYKEATTEMPGVTGCDRLAFEPTIEIKPDKLFADEPVGLGVRLEVPQVESPESVATPQLRDAVVTLPEGMSISPGVVDGIEACDESGPHGINFLGPESEQIGPNGEWQLAPGHCPDESIVGEAEAETALLPKPVKGHVYLARPACGGATQPACTEHDAADGELYQLYLELGGTGELADTGVEIKARGKVGANLATGQLTTKFEDNPQAPFTNLRIRLNGGPRASLDNPAVCGPAVTTARFTPWSAPGVTPEGLLVAGTADATSSSEFEVEGCETRTPFAPGFIAGTVTPQAGAFSAFTLNLSRQDREQYVKGIQLHTPPGLLAVLSSVPLCGEAEANAGTCSGSSKIGTTRVASGAGSHPFEIEGDVFLTGPFAGAPFGLSVVTRAVAGPFNLGLVVVRARIDIDPHNSTVLITFDETGPHAIPQVIFGVPLRLKRITSNIDRPGFMFNPTNCAGQQVTATLSGSQNTAATVSSPFAVGGCKSLVFKPKFTVSSKGHTSRTIGASLDAKLSYPAGSFGNAANIARVKVSLPKQLPSRLTTLQKACPAATFGVNPAGCPSASIVGIAKTVTPLLAGQLTGPVYFVSHGGEAFPTLIVVLQGQGVRVDLVGDTFISKAGITSSTFKTVPDVPVNSFELYLPQGRFSALAATGKLCKSQTKLKMPTEFVAQNGMVVKQNTKIAVTGCKAGSAKAARRSRARRNQKREHTARRSANLGSSHARSVR